MIEPLRIRTAEGSHEEFAKLRKALNRWATLPGSAAKRNKTDRDVTRLMDAGASRKISSSDKNCESCKLIAFCTDAICASRPRSRAYRSHTSLLPSNPTQTVHASTSSRSEATGDLSSRNNLENSGEIASTSVGDSGEAARSFMNVSA